eukprot:scaffold7993_cov33-Tisochrysis_lutea.AAC.1
MASVSDPPPFPRSWRKAELPRRPIARDRPKNDLEVVAMQSPELLQAGAGLGRTDRPSYLGEGGAIL